MSTSEARIRANQQNALKSTGPKTVEGKDRSKQNGLKHGLTGQGVVMSASDFAEVQRREVTLHNEMAPQTTIGAILVRQLATLSVRMERGARQEFAAVAERSRQAAEMYDQERVDQAEALFDELRSNPRRILQRLRKSPEGIERMLIAWRGLRADLTRKGSPTWSAEHVRTLANLLNCAIESTAGDRLVAISRASWGNFQDLDPEERTAMEPLERRAWAQALLLEKIDAGIADLEALLPGLDHETLAQDRAEAGERCLFNPSREATLARRYESEARRAFFKALHEFRKVESESVAVGVAEEDSAEAPALASSRESDEGKESRNPRPENPPARSESFGSDRARKTADDARNSQKTMARELAAIA